MDSRVKILRVFVGSASLIGAASLSACAPAGDKAADSAVGVPLPAPATAAESPASPDSASTRVTEYGYGPLRVGMTYAEANDSLKGALKAAPKADLAGCDYVNWTGGPKGLMVMVVANRIARIETTDSSLRTLAGAKIGDLESHINSLYPGRVTVMPHKYSDGHYLVVKSANPADSLNLIVFETEQARVTAFRAGLKPAVEYVEGCS